MHASRARLWASCARVVTAAGLDEGCIAGGLGLRFDQAVHHLVFEEHVQAVEAAEAGRNRLTVQIEAMLPDWELAPVVAALRNDARRSMPQRWSVIACILLSAREDRQGVVEQVHRKESLFECRTSPLRIRASIVTYHRKSRILAAFRTGSRFDAETHASGGSRRSAASRLRDFDLQLRILLSCSPASKRRQIGVWHHLFAMPQLCGCRDNRRFELDLSGMI